MPLARSIASTQVSDDLDLLESNQNSYYYSGATRSVRFRIEKLLEFRKALEQHSHEIYDSLRKDLGKSEREAYMTEFSSVLQEIDYFTTKLPRLARSKKVPTPIFLWPSKSYIHYEPLGRVLVISPWNFPFLLSLVPVVGAVAAGNCVVLKPSEISSHASQVMLKIISQCFAPEHVSVVVGGIEASQKLLAYRWGHVFFTGSTHVGKVVAHACAAHLTPMTLELGGKSPVIVTKSANLRMAARRIVYGKGLNSGQTCVAPDHVLVQDTIRDAFIGELKEQIRQQYGDAPAESSEYGRIVSHQHFDRLLELQKGCKVLFGGNHKRSDRYMELTILDEPDANAKISNEEIFGPLLPIYSFSSFPKVIEAVRAKPKPLAAYIFSEDRLEIEDFIAHFSFGGGCVNDTIVHPSNTNLKFGGIAASGIGSYNGHQSFKTFTHAKPIVDSPMAIDIPVRYLPVSKWKLKVLRLVK